MGEGSAFALDEVAYGVAKEPWTEGMGNHRAIVRVEQKTDAVLARIPWRRRDRDPERKQILVMDATTGQRIMNIARLHLDRFEGTLACRAVHQDNLLALRITVAPPPGNLHYHGVRLLLDVHDSPMIPHAFRPRFLRHAVSDFVQGKRRSRTHHAEQNANPSRKSLHCDASEAPCQDSPPSHASH